MEAHDVIGEAFYLTRGASVMRVRPAEWAGAQQWQVERFATVHRAWVLSAAAFDRWTAIDVACRPASGAAFWIGRVPRMYLLHQLAAEGWLQDLMLRGLVFANPLAGMDRDVIFKHPMTGDTVANREEREAIRLGVAAIAQRYGEHVMVTAMPDVSMEGMGRALGGRPIDQLTLQQYGCVAARSLYEAARAAYLRAFNKGGEDLRGAQGALVHAMEVVRRIEGGVAIEQIIELARCRWTYARELRARHAPTFTQSGRVALTDQAGLGTSWVATA